MGKSRLPKIRRSEALKKFKKGHGGFMTEREYHIFSAAFGMGWKERKKRIDELMAEEEKRKVKCVSCNNPIHDYDWGGLFTIKGLKGHFMIHNNKECLRRWMLDIKPELELKVEMMEELK